MSATTTDTLTNRRVTQAELARELGVTRQAINDLIKRGVLQLGDDKRIDAAEARAVIIERVRPSGRTAEAAAPAGPQTAAPENPDAEADAAASYYLSKAQREAAEAGIAQLKLRQMSGELIDRDAAVQAAFTAFRSLRDALGHLPRRIAGQLAAITTPRDAQLLLEDALRDTLDGFQRKTLAALAGNMAGGAKP